MGATNKEHRPLVSGIFISSGVKGGSVSHGEGTLTGLAKRNSDKVLMLVTNLHVVTGLTPNTRRHRLGNVDGDEELYQDDLNTEDLGKMKHPLTAIKKVGALSEYQPFVPSTGGKLKGVDIAACKLESGVSIRSVLHTSDNDSGHVYTRQFVPGVVEPKRGQTLIMLGATNGEGEVSVAAIDRPMTLESRNLDFDDVVLLDGLSRGFAGGDSGGPCFVKDDDGNYRLVCIAFASAPASSLPQIEGVTLAPRDHLWAIKASTAQQVLGVTFGNTPPVAHAGPDQIVAVGKKVVVLNSSESKDPDGDTITRAWEQVIETEGTPGLRQAVSLSSATRIRSTFSAPTTPRDLKFKLTVEDIVGETRSDTVTVKVVGPPAAPKNLSTETGDGKVTMRFDVLDDPSVLRYEARTLRRQSNGEYAERPWGYITDNTPEDPVPPRPGAKRVFETTVGHLFNGQAYRVEVRAVNIAGDGAVARTGPVTPGASSVPSPRNLTARAHSTGTGILYGFDAPENAPRRMTYVAELWGSAGKVRESQMASPPRKEALMPASAGAYARTDTGTLTSLARRNGTNDLAPVARQHAKAYPHVGFDLGLTSWERVCYYAL